MYSLISRLNGDEAPRHAAQFTSRYEIKYPLAADLIPEISRRLRLYADVDPHVPRDRSSYTVRTLYLDTPDLRCYYEKLDGLKVRKKLRIRAYGRESSRAFLEIKRRYTDIVVKERARYSAPEIAALLEGDAPDGRGAALVDEKSVRVADKFLYGLLKLRLRPTLLVLYEREAYIHRCAPYQRATIDTDIRYYPLPDIEDLYGGRGVVFLRRPAGLLELKFNDFMPVWMRRLQAEFDLRQEQFSKYASGIDACREDLTRERPTCPQTLWRQYS